jgi:hypothetical protein
VVGRPSGERSSPLESAGSRESDHVKPASRGRSALITEEVHNAAEIDRGADPKIRDQERTLAERLISELSATEFHPRITKTSTGSVY